MIEQKEINKIATNNRVSDRQIEKDYVLSWLLFAISKNQTYRSVLRGSRQKIQYCITAIENG
jgi:predicted nucleotidyltransferase component of viral defense system